MTARLEKRRTVLNRSHEHPGHVVYGSRSDEGNTLEVLYIPEETVKDLGDPDQITITIQPGDVLN